MAAASQSSHECQCGNQPQKSKFKRKGGIQYEDDDSEKLEEYTINGGESQVECTCRNRSVENSMNIGESDDDETPEHQKIKKFETNKTNLLCYNKNVLRKIRLP